MGGVEWTKMKQYLIANRNIILLTQIFAGEKMRKVVCTEVASLESTDLFLFSLLTFEKKLGCKVYNVKVVNMTSHCDLKGQSSRAFPPKDE